MGRGNGERKALGQKRLLSILHSHGIVTARTLEQKISDAGPTNQRINPHVLTTARNELVSEGIVRKLEEGGLTWYHLAGTTKSVLKERLTAQKKVYRRLHSHRVVMKIGQALEIAVYKALQQQLPVLDVLGAFTDLENHDDSTLYKKEEPPSTLNGRSIGKLKLDFLVTDRTSGWAGIEVKNVREWFYPHQSDLLEFLNKCVALDCVPVLIARRIPFVTMHVLRRCGVIFHETYNQLLPSSETELAAQAKQKQLLGFHDIRVGNEPDARLIKFIHVNLPKILPGARIAFNEHRDNLLGKYSTGEMTWDEFAARVRRRSQETNEDHDWEDSL